MIIKLKSNIISLLRLVRAPIVRQIKRTSSDIRLVNSTNPLKPISIKYGYDRGAPIDRVYIESFLEDNKDSIKGRCLEIHDTAYIKKFGGKKVAHSDALDIDTSNKQANIYGDLRNLKETINDNTYDCLVITHTINIIDDVDAAISECHRILKPGGILLLTIPGFIGPVIDIDKSFWRFNKNNTRYILKKKFDNNSIQTISYGNVLAGQAFLTGLSTEELSKSEISYNDPHFPIVIGAKAIKLR